jgi:hypothetical protein
VLALPQNGWNEPGEILPLVVSWDDDERFHASKQQPTRMPYA